MRVAAPLLSLALLTSACASAGGPSGQGIPPPPPPPGAGGVLTDWRGPITSTDRDRLDRLDRAWTQALAEARRTEGSGDLASVGNLIDPDAARPGAEPPVGDYRCRTIKLGNQGGGGLGYVVYGWFDCRVERTARGLRFSKLTGSQRQTGLLFPEAAERMVFLGGLALSDEPAANSYGQNPERDIVGVWERFGDRRWRLVMPYPVVESTLDLLEVVPR
ncbi:MAG: DUF4893 domain-containing protein [Alphaproteobacteria bacterium]|nr:DUF4893 domain-containing protein [Alphaproteobacteria bacterium]MBU1526447.1 DUF4893 domain-containing protein [Alphaproteobacteria bacterium]MBU2117787.1 DUF4893 domain-containing protein [Alphaproteobacteria bacterium]MBU2351996.1 DUF4893 domain-containing protein [Alphaproteobacteria bacterium]MBU2382610.1 DUF4893 domain-containing protein [Alphaproteobacteria bacterium]